MLGYNVPDDWSSYSRNCDACGGRYHLSEGHCDCDSAENRPECDRMYRAGYEYEGEGRWEKRVSRTVHTARRDHKDGTVKKGDRYIKATWRVVEFDDGDNRGYSYHRHFKMPIVPNPLRLLCGGVL